MDIVFAVDMFNEGVDLPTLDTVMMLRPTESKILWLQQFGRGLRKAPAKEQLTVIDYIGSYSREQIPPLFGLEFSSAMMKMPMFRAAQTRAGRSALDDTVGG